MQKILIIIAALALQACSNLEFPGVYKIPIEQGNVVTQEMVDQLKPGMNKSQVEFLLGTSLVKDTFNQQRWDYLYSVKRGGNDRQQYRLSVFFDENDQLSYFTGDFQPTSIDTTSAESNTAGNNGSSE